MAVAASSALIELPPQSISACRVITDIKDAIKASNKIMVVRMVVLLTQFPSSDCCLIRCAINCRWLPVSAA